MIITVTPGDPAGIGPEIVWKTLRQADFMKALRGTSLLCVGARAPFDRLGAPVIETSLEALRAGPRPPKSPSPYVWLLSAPSQVPKQEGKRASSLLLEGYQSGWAIEQAVALVQSKTAAALVTGPISKDRLQKGGYPYPGHTEFLADLCKGKGRGTKPEVTMMLANDRLRISLVTTHLALKDVPRAITRARVRRAILHTVEHLSSWWGIQKPSVGIAALNPHAGECGRFGREELDVISPEISALRRVSRGKFVLSDPLPADTLFAKHIEASSKDRFDAVVCMYHDQGLIPVKLLDFANTVNVTLGLPLIRTSVDHGVGFDIAGMDKANPSSLQSAIRLAIRIASHQKG